VPKMYKKTGQPTEYSEQCLIFQWSKLSEKRYPMLKLLHSSIMGTPMSRNQRFNLAKSGAKSGLPDIFLPYPSSGYFGLYIELKIKGGQVRPNQKVWLENLSRAGYFTKVCYGSKEAIEVIEAYVRIAKIIPLI